MKKRAANFTCEEKSELLDAVLKHRNVLFGRSLPLLGRYWAAKKAAWCEVVDAVNQVRLSPGRNVHECRRKLKDLKAATRKKFMDVNGTWRSDADMKNATSEELKILKLLGTEDKVEQENEIDLSIVKIEPDEPEIVSADNLAASESSTESDPEIVTRILPRASAPAPESASSAPVQLPVAPISVSATFTQMVEPIKRPVGQVVPVPAVDNPATAASAENAANAVHVTIQSLPASSVQNTEQNDDENENHNQIHYQYQNPYQNQYHNEYQNQYQHQYQNPYHHQTEDQDHGQHHTHDQDQGQSQDDYGDGSDEQSSEDPLLTRPPNQQPSDSRKRYFFTHSSQARAFADFSTQLPLKRIKLYVRNVPAGTSVGPSAGGNVLNFGLCSCSRYGHPGNSRDAAMQTEWKDTTLAMMEKIIDTQNMTAKALEDLARIAHGPEERKPKKEDESVGENSEQKEHTMKQEVVEEEQPAMEVVEDVKEPDEDYSVEEREFEYDEDKYEVVCIFDKKKDVIDDDNVQDGNVKNEQVKKE